MKDSATNCVCSYYNNIIVMKINVNKYSVYIVCKDLKLILV